jgi:hypothetical protein
MAGVQISFESIRKTSKISSILYSREVETLAKLVLACRIYGIPKLRNFLKSLVEGLALISESLVQYLRVVARSGLPSSRAQNCQS